MGCNVACAASDPPEKCAAQRLRSREGLARAVGLEPAHISALPSVY